MTKKVEVVERFVPTPQERKVLRIWNWTRVVIGGGIAIVYLLQQVHL